MSDVKIVKRFDLVKEVTDEAVFGGFSRASFVIAKVAKSLIRNRGVTGPSVPGQPVRSRYGLFRQAIKYYVDKQTQEAIIGPVKSRVGPNAARLHEHGGIFRGQSFEPRPFMFPALDQVSRRLPSVWKTSQS